MKKALIIIGSILLLVILSGFFFPQTNDFEKTIYIEASPVVVHGLVNDLEEWPRWSPWVRAEPDMQIDYGEVTAGAGAEYSWVGDEMGSGTLWITESTEQTIATKIDFGGGEPSQGIFTLTATNGGTTVGWRFINQNGWNPIARLISGVFIQPMVEDSYVEGLTYLAEEAMKEKDKLPAIDISEVDSDGIHYLGIRVSMPGAATMSAKIGELYGQLGLYTGKHQIQMSGMPMTLYHENEDGSIDMECAFQTAELHESRDPAINAGTTTTGTLLKGIHFGDYKDLGNSYTIMDNYISDKGYKLVGPKYEIYVTDPGVVTDTAKWQTEIYYPVTK